MELPLYHRPNFRTIFGNVRTRAVLFLRGAAVNIFAALIIVWAISTFPGGTVETSWLYRFGRWLEPLGSFLGFDWRFTVALLSSFVAKETTAGTLAVLFSVGATDHEAVVQALRASITPAGALAFIVASNLYIPCIASISVLRNELGSWGRTLALLAGHVRRGDGHGVRGLSYSRTCLTILREDNDEPDPSRTAFGHARRHSGGDGGPVSRTWHFPCRVGRHLGGVPELSRNCCATPKRWRRCCIGVGSGPVRR